MEHSFEHSRTFSEFNWTTLLSIKENSNHFSVFDPDVVDEQPRKKFLTNSGDSLSKIIKEDDILLKKQKVFCDQCQGEIKQAWDIQGTLQVPFQLLTKMESGKTVFTTILFCSQNCFAKTQVYDTALQKDIVYMLWKILTFAVPLQTQANFISKPWTCSFTPNQIAALKTFIHSATVLIEGREAARKITDHYHQYVHLLKSKHFDILFSWFWDK